MFTLYNTRSLDSAGENDIPLIDDEMRSHLFETESPEALLGNILAWLGFLVESSEQYTFEVTTAAGTERVSFLDMRLFIVDLDAFSRFLDSTSEVQFELAFEYQLVKYLFQKLDDCDIFYRSVRGSTIFSQGIHSTNELQRDCCEFARQLYEVGRRYEPEAVANDVFQEWYRRVTGRGGASGPP